MSMAPASSTFERMDPETNWLDFARWYVESTELDPLYVGLRGAQLPMHIKARFIVGMLLFYHCGSAGQLALGHGDDFWEDARRFYDTLPRGSYRRHFRGDLGRRTIDAWAARWPNPVDMVHDWMMYAELGTDNPKVLKQRDIEKWAEKVPQLGPYFTWKLGDYTEVLTDTFVDYRGCEKHAHNIPLKGAASIFPGDPAQALSDVAFYMMMADLRAPHAPHRLVNIQEAETVCCTIKDVRKHDYIKGDSAASELAQLRSFPENRVTTPIINAILARHPLPEGRLMDIARHRGFIKR